MRLFALLLLFQQSANATNRTWTNTGTDFNNGLNWGGTAPGSSDVAVFASAAITQPNLSSSLTIQELNFSTTLSSGYDLTSSSTSIKLTLTNTGTGTTSAINAANTSGTNTIDAPIILGAAGGSTQTFTQASGGTLIVNGVISSTNTVTLSLTGGTIKLTGANTYAGATTVTAGILNIQNATALGTTAAGTTVNSTATLQLQNDITVGAEALTISGTGASGQNGALVNVSGTNNYGGLLTLGAATTISSDSGTLNLTSTGTITGSGFGLTLTGSGNGTISSIIGTGTGTLTKNGSGTWTLTGANTYTGSTTVNAGDLSTGTFTLTPTGTVSIASGATYTSTGTLNLNPSTTAAQTFVSGAGTLRLRNPSSTALAPDIYYDPNFGDALHYQVTIGSNIDVGTGSRFINGKSDRNDFERYGGDLVFAGNLTGSANLTFTGTPNTPAGGVWQMAYVLQGNNSGFSGGITLTDGANLILENSNALTAANSVTFTPAAGAVSGLYLYGRSVTIGALSGTSAGTMTISNGSLVSDTNGTINPNIVRSNSVLTVQQSTNTTFNGAIGDGPNDHSTGDPGTYYTLGLTKTGTGTLTLGGTNTYTGVTTISAGTLQFAKQVSLYNNTTSNWTAAKIVVASGATAAFNVGGTGEFTSANIDTLKALGTASGGFKSGSILGLDTTNASGSNFTYGSAIANPNAGANVLGLTKLGTGTLTLTGANTFTGGTTISGGTLALGADSGGTQNTAANSLGTGAITIGSGTQLRFGGSSGAIVTYNFANNVTLNNGTIFVADGAQHLQGTFAVGASGGALITQYSTKDLYLDGVVSGSGALLIDNVLSPTFGDGQVHFTGTNTYSGTLTISASGSGSDGGKISVDSNTALSSATIAMNGPRDINFATTAPVFGALSGTGNITLTSGLNLNVGGNNGSTTYSGILSGAGALTKAGTGTMILSGANSYGGGTTIGSLGGANAGTLQLSGAGTVGATTGALTVRGGTLDLNGTIQTVSSILIGGGASGSSATIAIGTGELKLGGNITYAANNNPNGATISGTTGKLSLLGDRSFGVVDSTAAPVDLTVSAIIQNGDATARALTKLSTGVLVLSGNNTYSGTTSVNVGVLNIQNANALGSTAAGTTVNSTATLQLQNDITVGAEALTISGTGASGQNGALVNVSGTNNYGGLLTLGAASTVSSDSGTLNLTNTGTVTGATFGLTLTGSGNGSISSIIGTTTGTVTKSGSGVWTLSGANTFTGSTTINGGTLTAAASSGSALASTSGITVNSGGTLLLGASNQINNSATMTLAGGTFSKGNYSEGTASAVGIGALTLTASGSHLDLGVGTVGILTFASLTTNSNTLIIDNWTGTANTVGSASTDRLIFNSDQSANLSKFSFTGYVPGASEFSLGGGFYEVVPSVVPEPSTYAAGALALAALIYNQRKRFARLVPSDG